MIQLSAYKEHYKETIRLGVPIMLGQLGIIIVGFADNIIVGHHSTAELAAASLSITSLTWLYLRDGFLIRPHSYYRRFACQQGISQSRRDIEEQSFINFIVGVLLSTSMLLLLLNIDILKQPEELMPYIVPIISYSFSR